MSVTLEQAREIIRGALAKAREINLKPMSVVVLDAGGHVIAFERENGASAGRFDLARGKAYGSIMLGMAGRAQMARAEAQHYFMSAMNGLWGGLVVPVPGGVLLREKAGGPIIGAVGATGDTSDNDVIAIQAGVAAVGLVAED